MNAVGKSGKPGKRTGRRRAGNAGTRGDEASRQLSVFPAGQEESGAPVLQNLHRRWPVKLDPLRRILVASGQLLPRARARGVGLSGVTVYLVGARKMALINQRYLQHTGPTDVITFDYGDHATPEAGPRRLQGDVFVCLEVARRQAGEYGTSWQAEVVRYVVHGLLHLCGFDDLDPDARRRMKRIEHRIVRVLESRFAFKQLGRDATVAA